MTYTGTYEEGIRNRAGAGTVRAYRTHGHAAGRRRAKQRARRRQIVILAVLAVFACALFLILTLSLTARVAAADEKPVPIAYRSVQIKNGDTLWSIAEEWKTDEWKDTRVYVREIMRVNNLSSDVIHTGNYIIVPYFDHDLSHIHIAENA